MSVRVHLPVPLAEDIMNDWNQQNLRKLSQAIKSTQVKMSANAKMSTTLLTFTHAGLKLGAVVAEHQHFLVQHFEQRTCWRVARTRAPTRCCKSA